MRRADRLFLLIQALRGRRVITARRLAEKLEVSERTIYRDVQDLQLSGVPIEGETGVGYYLRHGSDIPPLMFTRDELEALIVGARLVESLTSDRLSDSAKQALLKIEGVVPDELRANIDNSRIYAPPSYRQALMGEMHHAIDKKLIVDIKYQREDRQKSTRRIWPLCLAFFSPYWLLGAWCEMRQDYRSFRLDRIHGLEIGGTEFEEDENINLKAYLAHVGAEP